MSRGGARVLRRLWVGAFACLLATGSFAVAGGVATPAAATVSTPVMGSSVLSAAQLASWYHHKHSTPANVPSVGNNVATLAQIFINEGRADGVRGDVAFVQSMIETGWLSFPSTGQIPATFNNFAGLFAFNNRPRGTTCAAETAPSRCFSSPNLGVRYQIQLLRGYADSAVASLTGRLIYPPSDRIGLARNWERFGGAQTPIVWATAPGYGPLVVSLYNDALAYSGISLGCSLLHGSGSGTVGTGYWLFGSDARVYARGTAVSLGSPLGRAVAPIVAAEATPGRHGYWLMAANGDVWAFGTAPYRGSPHGLHLRAPVNGFSESKTGQGYWVSASDGGVFAFGDARFAGSLGGATLQFPIAAIEATANGDGYWLMASDGGIYSFGRAGWQGSTRALKLSVRFVDIERSAVGNGYYLLRRDGAVYAYGAALAFGDISGCGIGDAARIVATPTGLGYWIVTTRGGVVAFGDAAPIGGPASVTSPIVGFELQH